MSWFVLFRYLPLQRRIKATKWTRTAQMLAIAKASGQGEQLPALEKQLLKLQRVVANYERQVPWHRGLGMFLHKIADLMDEQNLKEQVIRPGKEIEADGLHCMPVSMQCKGTLKQIFGFYKSLQGLDRLVRVEQVKLENESDFSGKVCSQTKAVIYYRSKEN